MNRTVVLAVVVLALVSACSDDDATVDSTSAAPSTTAAGVDTTAAGPATTTTMPGLTEVPTLEGEVGAKVDSSTERCEATDGGWIGEGTVTNPTDEPVDYAVVVSFLDAANATLGADANLIRGVAPGDTAPWSVELPVNGDDLQCILRVTRAPAAG
jgi:hypothetical protein